VPSADARESSRGSSASTAATPDDLRRAAEQVVGELQTAERARQIDALLVEASTQRERGQPANAMATLARARELAPDRDAVRQAQEALAIDWIRNVRFETHRNQPGFVDMVAVTLSTVDAAVPSSTGTRRADLLAHAGWAMYMLWRNASLTGVWRPTSVPRADPAERYREALAIDPENPFANAMLAHRAFRQDGDPVSARQLFDNALRTRREVAYVRDLQWTTFGSEFERRNDQELVRVADDMRRHGERLNVRQAQTLYGPYSSLTNASTDDRERPALLDAVSADDHIATVAWAFDEFAKGDDSRRWTLRFIVALLHERAGRVDRAVAELRALNEELPKQSTRRPSVEAALNRLVAGSAPRERRE
jgi:tetratricopeptide (TPR) repeat protein